MRACASDTILPAANSPPRGVTAFSGSTAQTHKVLAGLTALIFGLVPKWSSADDTRMAYIISRSNRFYVVAYDGVDPAKKIPRSCIACAASKKDGINFCCFALSSTPRVR